MIHHPQVVQSTIANDCLKVKMDAYTEPQPVPNFLLLVSVREPHNNLVSATIDGGLKESRDEDDKIIISDSTFCLLFPPQYKKCHQDKRSRVVANVAYLPKLCIHHYYHGLIVI